MTGKFLGSDGVYHSEGSFLGSDGKYHPKRIFSWFRWEISFTGLISWLGCSDQEIGRLMRYLYGQDKVDGFIGEMETLRQAGQAEAAERMKRPYVQRMANLEAFMKTLKQRGTIGTVDRRR